MKIGHMVGSMSQGAIHNFGRSLTLLLVFFQFLILVLRPVIGDVGMQVVQGSLWFCLLVYLNFQLLETCRRDPTNLLGFFLDSLLAGVGILAGLAFFLLVAFKVGVFASYAEEEKSIMAQCTLFGATDLLWGALISLRIAFAGKERGEFEKRAQTG